MKIALSVIAGLAAAALAAPAADEIKSLPGWDDALPSKMWSGYVDIANGRKHVHYVYVESQTSPETRPIVLWSNGGPGSSSLIGWLTELGTFKLDGRSTANASDPTPRLIRNPNAWAKHANMLYFEHPTPVGFSYCDDAAACEHDDQGAADDLYACIEQFFETKFPELKGRDFWLTGESYAGIYLPMTALVIDQKADPSVIKLQGMAIGDGCIGNQVGTCSDEGPGILAKFLHGQSFISDDLYAKIGEQCVNYFDPSQQCQAALNEMDRQSGDYYIYMIYSQCANNQALPSQGTITRGAPKLAYNARTGGMRVADFVDETAASHAIDALGNRLWSSDIRTAQLRHNTMAYKTIEADTAKADDIPTGTPVWYCGGDAAMSAWTNDKAVQTALHVKTDVPNYPFKYNRSEANLLPQYPHLASKYRVLIYSGNVDACIPTPGTQQWTAGLGFDVLEGWRPWTGPINGAEQTGGFAVTYNKNNFTFLTLSLSGHMAPQFVSEASEIMFQRFIGREAY